MSKRIKLPSTACKTRADLEIIVREIAELTLARNTQQTMLDRDLTAVRAKYETQLTTLGKSLEEKTEVARAYCEANPAEFGRNKSLACMHGTLGWRTGNPTLKTLAGWTWTRVLAAIQQLRWRRFIRVKIEPNKEAILIARDRLRSKIAQIGLRVHQDETFFVDPNLTALDNRQTSEAA